MAKRKAAVNDIIYELDNEDIEISSDDEAKEPKINRIDVKNTENSPEKDSNNEENNSVIEIVDTPAKEIGEKPSSTNTSNGGKISPDNSFINLVNDSVDSSRGLKETEEEVDCIIKVNTEGNKTTIFNEDIIIDSPTSTSDLGVVGCENRTPLVTIRFRDKKLASNYKRKVKAFMLRLIKLHEKENSDIESETDIELDIWPEDLNDEEDFPIKPEKVEQDNLFFVDTDPCSNQPDEIPAYKEVILLDIKLYLEQCNNILVLHCFLDIEIDIIQLNLLFYIFVITNANCIVQKLINKQILQFQASALISNQEEKEQSPPQVLRRGPVCFNCDGAHQLRDCKVPRNYARIAEKRKNMTTRVG